MATAREQALQYHEAKQGKISIAAKVPLANAADLALAYTPGVAEPCREIARDPGTVFQYTNRGNQVGIVTDGSAVLGLGNIGPEAALPVMEGKALLFKLFGGVDAIPICLATQDPDEIVETVKRLEPTFGGINLEDVSAPRAFWIADRLQEVMDIPVFNDDQHGTAVVVGATLLNALQLVGKRIEDLRVVVSGAGAAATATTKHLLAMGCRDITLVDGAGAIYAGRSVNMNPYKEEIAGLTNLERRAGDLRHIIQGADLFLGLSAPGLVDTDMVRSMASRAIVLALANPVPEILPDAAKAGGAAIIATGRSDFANQVNNSLAFPGIFRGALDVQARRITPEMRMAASKALAELVDPNALSPEYIIPTQMDPRVAPAVAASVAELAIASGVARVERSPEWVAEHCRQLALMQA